MRVSAGVVSTIVVSAAAVSTGAVSVAPVSIPASASAAIVESRGDESNPSVPVSFGVAKLSEEES
jgi:hypothetical protein